MGSWLWNVGEQCGGERNGGVETWGGRGELRLLMALVNRAYKQIDLFRFRLDIKNSYKKSSRRNSESFFLGFY